MGFANAVLLVMIIWVSRSLGMPLVRKLGLSAINFIINSFTLAMGNGAGAVAGAAVTVAFTPPPAEYE